VIRRPSPPKPETPPWELRRVKKEAENRMKVYDAAPRDVRGRAKRYGDGPVVKWWKTLSQFTQERVLELRSSGNRFLDRMNFREKDPFG